MHKKTQKRAAMAAAVISACIMASAVTTTASTLVLKRGMQSGDVTALQANLKTLGYFNANTTGFYGGITEAAVRQLQADYGLWQDGIAGPVTFTKIDSLLAAKNQETPAVSSTTGLLKYGMRSGEVAQLQTNLKTLGYFNANTTGFYGGITEAAVRQLQADYGLWQDGIAGPVTFTKIDSLLAAKNQETPAVSSTAGLLKYGMRSGEVAQLQTNLKTLGYFSIEPTGYYGEITTAAVRRLQADNGLLQDGISGPATKSVIDRLLTSGQAVGQTAPSRGETDRNGYLVPWFGGAENIFSIGSVAEIYDIDSGLSFMAKRTYGYNHADCEPLTYNDAMIMKQIYGGAWSWERRAIIVTVNGQKIAASMAGMPHAGNDAQPANAYVQWRSGDYGAGTNLDTVKGNGVDGHFDVHFLGSRTHGTDRVDSAHQSMVQKAADWAARNY